MLLEFGFSLEGTYVLRGHIKDQRSHLCFEVLLKVSGKEERVGLQRTDTWPLFIFGLFLATFSLLLAFLEVEEARKSNWTWEHECFRLDGKEKIRPPHSSFPLPPTHCPFPGLTRDSVRHRKSRNLYPVAWGKKPFSPGPVTEQGSRHDG